MLQICRTCGSETTRLRTIFEIAGKPLPEPKDECPNCAEIPAGQRLNDQKLWLMQDVNPNEYETVGGEKHLKDWASAELRERIAKPDEDDVKAEWAAKDAKRKFNQEVRGRVPTRTESEQAANIARDILAQERARRSGLILPT